MEVQDFQKIPHIEQLALHLVDATREDPEVSTLYAYAEFCQSALLQVNTLKETILAFIAGLAVADPEALTILVESETLIPAIVIYLCETTSLIWEEDEQVITSPALIES